MVSFASPPASCKISPFVTGGRPRPYRHPVPLCPACSGTDQAIGRVPSPMRTYELMFVVDPRVSDEEVVAMTHDYHQMIVGGGSEVTKEENWGRRKLAYPIEKLTEGKYVVFYIASQGGKTSLPEVE